MSKKELNYGAVAIVTLVLCGISFAWGVGYQKAKQTAASNAGANDTGQFPTQGGGPGGQGRFGNGQRPNMGQVSTVSSESITVQDSRPNSTQTFKITSNTTVQNNGSTAAVSDIKTGDTVLITTSSSDTSTATRIMLNPSFSPPSSDSTQGSPSLQ